METSHIENYTELVCGLLSTLSENRWRQRGDRFGQKLSEETQSFMRVLETDAKNLEPQRDGLISSRTFCLSFAPGDTIPKDIAIQVRNAIHSYCLSQTETVDGPLVGVLGQLIYDGVKLSDTELLAFWGWQPTEESSHAVSIVVSRLSELASLAFPLDEFAALLNERFDRICFTPNAGSKCAVSTQCGVRDYCLGKEKIVAELLDSTRKINISKPNVVRIIGDYGTGKTRLVLCYAAAALSLQDEQRSVVYLDLEDASINFEREEDRLESDQNIQDDLNDGSYWSRLDKHETKSKLHRASEEVDLGSRIRRRMLRDVLNRWLAGISDGWLKHRFSQNGGVSQAQADALYLLVSRGFVTLAIDNIESTRDPNMAGRLISWLHAIFGCFPASRIIFGLRQEILSISRKFDREGFEQPDKQWDESGELKIVHLPDSENLSYLLSDKHREIRDHLRKEAEIYWPYLFCNTQPPTQLAVDNVKNILGQIRQLTSQSFFFERLRRRLDEHANNPQVGLSTPFQVIGYYVVARLFSSNDGSLDGDHPISAIVTPEGAREAEVVEQAACIAFSAELSGLLTIGKTDERSRFPSVRDSGLLGLKDSSENEIRKAESIAVLRYFLSDQDTLESGSFTIKEPILREYLVGVLIGLCILKIHTLRRSTQQQNRGSNFLLSIDDEDTLVKFIGLLPLSDLSSHCAASIILEWCTCSTPRADHQDRLGLVKELLDHCAERRPQHKSVSQVEIQSSLSFIIARSRKFSFDKHRKKNIGSIASAVASLLQFAKVSSKLDCTEVQHASSVNSSATPQPPEHAGSSESDFTGQVEKVVRPTFRELIKWHPVHQWAEPIEFKDRLASWIEVNVLASKNPKNPFDRSVLNDRHKELFDRMLLVAPSSSCWIGSPVVLSLQGNHLSLLVSCEGIVDARNEDVDLLLQVDGWNNALKMRPNEPSIGGRALKVPRSRHDRIKLFEDSFNPDKRHETQLRDDHVRYWIRRPTTDMWEIEFDSLDIHIKLYPAGEMGCLHGYVKSPFAAPFAFYDLQENYLGSFDETPAHQVELSPFLMDRMPVTNAEFAVFLATEQGHRWGHSRQDVQKIRNNFKNPYYMHLWDFETVSLLWRYLKIDSSSGRQHLRPHENRWAILSRAVKMVLDGLGSDVKPYQKRWLLQPAVYVNFYAALEFAHWCRKRLPTEAEWEVAARGGLHGQIFPWQGFSMPTKHELFSKKTDWEGIIGDRNCEWEKSLAISKDITPESTMNRPLFWEPFGEYMGEGGEFDPLGFFYTLPQAAKGFGLYHLVGGVREWTLDAYDPSAYSWRKSLSSKIHYCHNPLNLSVGSKLSLSEFNGLTQVKPDVPRVLRGGSFATPPDRLRCSHRDPLLPGNVNPDAGFRCVVDLPEYFNEQY
jgi:formylglycine-generating enzyme required for sulfatase activity